MASSLGKVELKNREVLPKTCLLNGTITKIGAESKANTFAGVPDDLNKMRAGNTEMPNRGKKLNVTAGKSSSMFIIPTLIDDLESGKD